jgi:hypothetical protein
MSLYNQVLLIDFDGTIVEHEYPEIGSPMPYAFDTLKQLKADGAKLVLWTCREDMKKRKYLTEAVEFCRRNGIEFDAVNEALVDCDFRDPDQCKLRKPHARIVIDDTNFGGFPGWEMVGQVLLQNKIMTWTAVDMDTHFQIRKQSFFRGETAKAHARRVAEGWFGKFAPPDKLGIDIGCQSDPLNETFRRWDIIFGDGDATFMQGVDDGVFHTVYASHILEHLNNPVEAIKNWYRITAPGGHLVAIVPHRDLYEKRKELPSRWNPAHKFFWLPAKTEAPCTLSLRDIVLKAIPGADIVHLRTIDTDYNYKASPDEHASGEFSIEIVVKKPESS